MCFHANGLHHHLHMDVKPLLADALCTTCRDLAKLAAEAAAAGGKVAVAVDGQAVTLGVGRELFLSASAAAAAAASS